MYLTAEHFFHGQYIKGKEDQNIPEPEGWQNNQNKCKHFPGNFFKENCYLHNLCFIEFELLVLLSNEDIMKLPIEFWVPQYIKSLLKLD